MLQCTKNLARKWPKFSISDKGNANFESFKTKKTMCSTKYFARQITNLFYLLFEKKKRKGSI